MLVNAQENSITNLFEFIQLFNKSQELITPFSLCYFLVVTVPPPIPPWSSFPITAPLGPCMALAFHFPCPCSSSLSHSGAGTRSRKMMDDHLSQLVYYISDNQLHIPNAGCPAGNLHARHRPMWKWNLICQMPFCGYSAMITAWLFQQLCVSDNVITYCLPQVTLLEGVIYPTIRAEAFRAQRCCYSRVCRAGRQPQCPSPAFVSTGGSPCPLSTFLSFMDECPVLRGGWSPTLTALAEVLLMQLNNPRTASDLIRSNGLQKKWDKGENQNGLISI